MNEQIYIEEKAKFFTEKKDVVEKYALFKEQQGYKVKIISASPKGWIVVSSSWIVY